MKYGTDWDHKAQNFPDGGYSGVGGDAAGTDYDKLATAAQAAADALTARVADDLAACQATPSVYAAVVAQMRDALGAIRSDNDHNYQWLRASEQQARTQAAQALDAAEGRAQDAIASIRATVARATATPAPSGMDALLREMQITNAWAAVRAILTAPVLSADPLKAIELAVEAAGADPLAREAIRRFGPSWIVATYAGRPQAERDRIADAMDAGLDQAEAPTMNALQKCGRAILAGVATGESRLRVGAHQARTEINGQGEQAALPGWAEGETVALMQRIAGRFQQVAPAALGEAAQEWARTARKQYPFLFIGR